MILPFPERLTWNLKMSSEVMIAGMTLPLSLEGSPSERDEVWILQPLHENWEVDNDPNPATSSRMIKIYD